MQIKEGMAQVKLPPPQVLWAQRKNSVLLTVLVGDCIKPEIKIDNQCVYFKGIGGMDQKEYEVAMDFYKEINPEESKYYIRGRSVDFFIKKKEEGPFWPHLLKQSTKQHWLKVDFNKWKDEDEDDENPDFDTYPGDFGDDSYMGDVDDMDEDNVSNDDLSHTSDANESNEDEEGQRSELKGDTETPASKE